MQADATQNLLLMFGLIGVVVVIAALLSGVIEKSNFPQVAVFLALGAAIGPFGFGLLDVGLDSPILRMVATLSLALVLFTDALTIDLGEVRKHAKLALLILGPGTLIAAGAMTLAGVSVLNLTVPMAAILAAALASTDPVMLRGLLKRPDLPSAARQALRLESGLNDVVLLPVVILAMAFAGSGGGEQVSIFRLLLQMLVVGPGAGALVAWLGIVSLEFMRKRVGVRRDYESLYSLGLALAAYAAAESLHGSGFLAAFAAGLTISAIDVDLCDCFREYGETTAEILLLFTFVLLGTSLIWTGISLITVGIGVFVALALMARPAGLLLALAKSKTSPRAKGFIVWYGPRGLSTLLLVLLPVFAGVPGSIQLFHIASVVVLVSVAVHGGSIMFFGNRGEKKVPAERALVEVPQATVEAVTIPERMTVAEVQELIRSGQRVILADVRQPVGYLESPTTIKDSVRLHPQFARRDAERAGVPKSAYVAVFCACPDDATSLKVAGELKTAGWKKAFSVRDGWDALLAGGFETETKSVV